jgi:hypothetical protein
MNPALLALFLRSLREDARNRGTYGARTALDGLIVLGLLSFTAAVGWAGAPGLIFLQGVITLQWLAITFLGLSYFTSAITEEKEEQTLILLRMADLGPLAILFGKSTSRLCGALLLLTAQIPFTIFAVTLGGVSLRQVFAVYAALVAYTFFLCNLALLGSVLARRTVGATIFCLATMALLVAAGRSVPWVEEAMPFVRLDEILTTGFSGSPLGWQFLSNLTAGTGCFLLAWALFGRFCDRAPDSATGGFDALFHSFRRGRSRPPAGGKRAVAWKDHCFLNGGLLGLVVRAVIYGSLFLLTLAHALELPWLFWVSFLFSIDLAWVASRIFRIEINEKTLAGLAILPCGLADVARGKSRAALLAVTPGAIATGAAHLLVLAALAGNSFAENAGAYYTVFSLWVSAVGLAHMVAWLSLYHRRSALPRGYLITVLGCGIIFGLFGSIFDAIFQSSRPGQTPSWPALFLAVFVALFAAVMIVAPSWLLRGAIPLELRDLAGRE